MKHADLALYGAKADGRGAYRFFQPEMDERAKKWEGDMQERDPRLGGRPDPDDAWDRPRPVGPLVPEPKKP